MGQRLSPDEVERIYELNDAGYSQKEIADKVCQEFNREDLDRTTIYRWLQKRPQKSQRSPRRPTNPIQQEAYDRCQIRSEEYPQGDHTWMNPGMGAQRFEDQAFSKEVFYEDTDPESMPTVRYIFTCYFCGCPEEWSTEGVPIVERAFGEQLLPVTKKPPYKEENPG